MTTIGWLFILFALYVGRAFTKGRTIDQSVTDLGELMTALLTNNQTEVKAILARTGTGTTADQAGPDTTEVADDPVTGFAASGSANGAHILATAKSLGSAAKGYRTGGTGPTYYDCSGLVWKTLKTLGIYTGPRFTTYTFTKQVPCTQVTKATAAIGDIVLWVQFPNHHMGIVSSTATGVGADTFYSARNPSSGIRDANIEGFFKNEPTYWRVKG